MKKQKPAAKTNRSGKIDPQNRGPIAPSRGSSFQGALHNSKGGPAGAAQGGASRGSSRLEPSHQHQANKTARAGKGKKGY